MLDLLVRFYQHKWSQNNKLTNKKMI